jgi:hypothetical protein
MSTSEPAATWHFSKRLSVPTAELNTCGQRPFTTVNFPDGSWVSIADPDAADQIAAAFTEAARLLREARTEGGQP